MRCWSFVLPLLPIACFFAGCSRDGTSQASRTRRPSLGNVMVEVGRRFEVAGRAAEADRFELAAFEVGEIEEMFTEDVPNAEPPKEGPTAHIPAMATAFLEGNVPALKRAAVAKDRAAFAAAFQRAASGCNACHLAAAKGFIQVPFQPGKSVPDLDPIAPSSAPAQPSHP